MWRPKPLGIPAPCYLSFFSKGFEETARWQVLCPMYPHLEISQGKPQTLSLHKKRRGSPPAFRGEEEKRNPLKGTAVLHNDQWLSKHRTHTAWPDKDLQMFMHIVVHLLGEATPCFHVDMLHPHLFRILCTCACVCFRTTLCLSVTTNARINVEKQSKLLK